jgi:hypothetical protein
MEAIKADRVLSEKIKYILIDMGWADRKANGMPSPFFREGCEKWQARLENMVLLPEYGQLHYG